MTRAARDPGYTRCKSGAGAEGTREFMPDTAREYRSYEEALAAYNGGSGRLEEALAACGHAWLSCEPTETQRYVEVIMYG